MWTTSAGLACSHLLPMGAPDFFFLSLKIITITTTVGVVMLPAVPALGGLWQEDPESKAILRYIESLRPAWRT